MAGMAEWRKEWQNSRMAEMATYVLFMVHADDDDDTDVDSLIFYNRQADRAYGTEISPRSFVISFVILLYQYLYLLICHYVSCRLKEIADASMQAVESHC